MNDVTMATLHTALRGLAQRQRVISDNIANIETPSFIAGRVDFEDSLRGALESGNPQLAEATASQSTAPTNVNGNNVQLDTETVASLDTGLRYQLTLEAMNAKFRLLRASLAAR